MIVDLNLVTIVNGHPFFTWFDRNADENAGIVVHIAHFKCNAELAFADFAAGPVEKAHAAMRFDKAIFHGHATWAHVLPAGEVLAVEELFPVATLCSCRKRNGNDCDDCDAHKRENSSYVHGASGFTGRRG